MENRVMILFFVILALSFLFVSFSFLFLRRRNGTNGIVPGILWMLLLLSVSVPLYDVFNFIELKLFINYTGGIRVEVIDSLADRALFTNIFLSKGFLDALRTVCTALVALRIITSAAYFSYSFGGYLNNLHFLTKFSEECHDDKIKRIFARAKKTAGLRRNISLRVMKKNISPSPCTCGIVFPSVYIGKEILYDYADERLELVFLHELMHIRHHDSALKFFALIVTSFFRGLPFSGMISGAVYEDAEYRCDAAVIGKAGRECIGEYMAMIIDIAERNIGNDYGGYDYLSPMSKSGELLLRRYRMMNQAEKKKNADLGLIGCIAFATAVNILLLSSISVANADNMGVDLASPLMEKAVCGYFGIEDPENITEAHINSVYCIEFRLSDLNEELKSDGRCCLIAAVINEGLVYNGDVYAAPDENLPDYRLVCDLTEDELHKDASVHYAADRKADTRDITLFHGLRTLVFADYLKSSVESVYESDQYAVIWQAE